MKYHVTQKYIRAVYSNRIYSVGYGNAQYLLIDCQPFAYNSGVYGWNCDYYAINGVCLCIGYRPHGIKTEYEKTRIFEAKAESIYNMRDLDYETRFKKIEAIRNEWLTALMEG